MLPTTETSRSHRRLLAGLIALVGALSCIIVLMYHDYFLLGDPVQPNNDDVKYIQSARLLLNEGVLAYNTKERPSAFIMPGMPVLLGGFMAVFGQEQGGVIAFRLYQCLLQSFSIYLIYFIGRKVFSPRAGLIAAIISAFYMPDYFASGVILSEGTFRTLLLLLVCVTLIAREKNRTWLYVLIGILTAAAAYFKPHASLYPAVFLVIWYVDKLSWRQAVKYLSVMTGVYVLLLCPWWIRNWLTFHEWITFTNSGGSPFLLGTRIYGQLPPPGFFEEYPRYSPETLFQGADHTAVQKGLDILSYGLRHEPLKYIYWLTLGRWIELYFHPFYSRPIWPITRPIMDALQILLMLGNMAGIAWAMFKRGFLRLLPLWLALGYFTVIYMPFVAFGRYGYPNMALLILFAAGLIDGILAYRQTPSLKTDRRRTSSS